MTGPVATVVTRLVIWFLAAAVFAMGGLLWWWCVLDPIIPKVEVIKSTIPGAEDGFTRPGSFEVKRTFENQEHAQARVCAYLMRRPQLSDLVRDGHPVVPDTGQYEIGCADTKFVPGEDLHDRFWQLPLLPAADYDYVSKLVFCNPMRCKEKWLPAIPMKLR